MGDASGGEQGLQSWAKVLTKPFSKAFPNLIHHPNVTHCEDMRHWLGALSGSAAHTGSAQKAERICYSEVSSLFNDRLFPAL